MQLWPATIASPSHEAYAHGTYNYSVSSQQKTMSVAERRRRWTLFWSSEGLEAPFFVYDDPPEHTSVLGIPGRSG
jgi:hypothetical protein